MPSLEQARNNLRGAINLFAECASADEIAQRSPGDVFVTHRFDTSAIPAHSLAEPGAERVPSLFDEENNIVGICVLTLLALETRFRAMRLDGADRQDELLKYKRVSDNC